jgi:hypothetical protein
MMAPGVLHVSVGYSSQFPVGYSSFHHMPPLHLCVLFVFSIHLDMMPPERQLAYWPTLIKLWHGGVLSLMIFYFSLPTDLISYSLHILLDLRKKSV